MSRFAGDSAPGKCPIAKAFCILPGLLPLTKCNISCSVIDIISEGIFGIVGLLDDLIITIIFFLHVAALYRSILCLRHGRNFRFE
ncbi:hypothetical protein MtrunA17_Chr2g0326461 [Medicago truncatula]|uniref:RING-type E3 ubiquitin transferase n=1 Tax=Medicago truncatula TaxID=3880 RepID=A0A396JFL9_MEDTR|nr:hypothetical protein MtrunA17_Chr2g0326461 [Medicago truncatula]